MIRFALITLALAHLPQVEWNFSKQKGGTTPGSQSAEIAMLTQQLAALQAQLTALTNPGPVGPPIIPYTPPEAPLMGQEISNMPSAGGTSYGEPMPYMAGQSYMPQSYMPQPQMIPVMPVMMPAPQQYQQGGLLEMPLRLLRNMSLTITPITQMIKATQGGKPKHQKSHGKPVKETKKIRTTIKETFHPNGAGTRTTTTNTLDHGPARLCGSAGCDEMLLPHSVPLGPVPDPMLGPMIREAPFLMGMKSVDTALESAEDTIDSALDSSFSIETLPSLPAAEGVGRFLGRRLQGLLNPWIQFVSKVTP